ncbi:hypothetical protein HDV62DRAFT_326088 [Trichoderma sp. SZMC 28011]
MQPWPGLLRIKVMLCMAWAGLALTYRYEHVTVQRVQRGARQRAKKSRVGYCTVIGHAAAATWCGAYFRLGDKCRHLIRTRRGSKGTWKGKGHRNRLIGRETRMWKKEKRTLQAALGSISPPGHGIRSDCTGQPETWAIKA